MSVIIIKQYFKLENLINGLSQLGRKFEYELEIAKQYEPKLFTAANNIFNESYEYTRQYKKFKKKIEV